MFSISASREVHIETDLRFHLTPVRMAKTTEQLTNVGELVGRGKPHSLLFRMQIGATILEINMVISKKS